MVFISISSERKHLHFQTELCSGSAVSRTHFCESAGQCFEGLDPHQDWQWYLKMASVLSHVLICCKNI